MKAASKLTTSEIIAELEARNLMTSGSRKEMYKRLQVSCSPEVPRTHVCAHTHTHANTNVQRKAQATPGEPLTWATGRLEHTVLLGCPFQQSAIVGVICTAVVLCGLQHTYALLQVCSDVSSMIHVYRRCNGIVLFDAECD